MIYVVERQIDVDLWTALMPPDDTIYEYDNETDALAKADELYRLDPSGRNYRVITR